MKSTRRIIAALIAFVVFLLGAFGFKLIGGEDWTYLNSVWMTVITLSTVGYGEAHEGTHNPALRVFAVVFNLVCLGTIASTPFIWAASTRKTSRRAYGLCPSGLGREAR